MARGFWPPGFRSLNNVKRWRRSRPGGWGEPVRDEAGGQQPKHEHIAHTDTSLTVHNFQPLGCLTVRIECACDRVTKSQDGLGTMVVVVGLGCLP